MMFPLTNDDKNRLRLLNNDSTTVFALKKLFLNVCTDNPPSNEAIKKITEAFHDLSVIKTDSQHEVIKDNIV